MNIDNEFLDTKLKDYELLTDLSTVAVGDHMRCTLNRYKEDGRKCSYIIVKSIDGDILTVNGYKSTYSNWKIDPQNKYKEYKFYKKVQPIYTGECKNCGCDIDEPYIVCLSCR
tara:strand:- start:3871 stop:4209 length:339 start_codon:yes stop_codon:yes gene_type:complete